MLLLQTNNNYTTNAYPVTCCSISLVLNDGCAMAGGESDIGETQTLESDTGESSNLELSDSEDQQVESDVSVLVLGTFCYIILFLCTDTTYMA